MRFAIFPILVHLRENPETLKELSLCEHLCQKEQRFESNQTHQNIIYLHLSKLVHQNFPKPPGIPKSFSSSEPVRSLRAAVPDFRQKESGT